MGKPAEPSNVASGLLRGAGAVLQSVFSAIAGFFMDPIRGAKQGGFSGAMVGFGKGLVGLVMKPVAGTLDLVTLTARGIANTPKTVYLKLGKVFKKKEKLPRSTVPIEPYLEDQCVIPIVDKGKEYNLYLDEEELRKEIMEGLKEQENGNKEEPVAAQGTEDSVQESMNRFLQDEIKKRLKRQKNMKKSRILQLHKKQKTDFIQSLEAALNSYSEKLAKSPAVDDNSDDSCLHKGGEQVGSLEMEFEGFPTPEGTDAPRAGTLEAELGNLESVEEFDEEENRHFSAAAEDFAVRCDFVNVGVGEEGDDELVEEAESCAVNSVVRKSVEAAPRAESAIVSMTAGDVRYRKNPMHRVPPSKDRRSV